MKTLPPKLEAKSGANSGSKSEAKPEVRRHAKHNAQTEIIATTARMGRRNFARVLAVAAAVACGDAVVPGTASATASLCSPLQSSGTLDPVAAPNEMLPVDISPEQQVRVRARAERDARERATMRTAPLAYDIEPAFAFSVRRPERPRRKP